MSAYKCCGVEGQPLQSPHISNRWDRSHLSSASRFCFIFPATDNVAYITTVRLETDLDSVRRREWPNYLAIHQLRQTLSERLTGRPQKFLVRFVGCPQKLNFLWQIWVLYEVSIPSLPGREPNDPAGLCYDPCSWEHTLPNCLTIWTHFGDQYGDRTGLKVGQQFLLWRHSVDLYCYRKS